MEKFVTCSTINWQVEVPASKSMAQRAIVAALLTGGVCTLRNLTLCDDTLGALNVVRQCGVEVEQVGREYRLNAVRVAWPSVWHCGESGLLARVLLPVAALADRWVHLEGAGSLLSRPVGMLEEPLRALGVSVSTRGGCLPAEVRGPMQGGEIFLDGRISSQALTGLLLALPLVQRDSVVHVEGLVSTPYVEMTLDLLARLGIRVEHEDYRRFFIPGRQAYAPFVLCVEGDWSAASCVLVAGALAGEVQVTGLALDTRQADVALLEVLRVAGVDFRVEQTGEGCIVTTRRGDYRGFEFDATDCPDLFPALVALAAGAQGVSRLRGVHRLVHKESNRAAALQMEFEKLGIAVTCEEDEMIVRGGVVRGGVVDAHGDHRVAMALAVTALRANAPVCIRGAESVAKSYPAFWELFNDLL